MDSFDRVGWDFGFEVNKLRGAMVGELWDVAI